MIKYLPTQSIVSTILTFIVSMIFFLMMKFGLALGLGFLDLKFDDSIITIIFWAIQSFCLGGLLGYFTKAKRWGWILAITLASFVSLQIGPMD